jgi:hypothetical protein
VITGVAGTGFTVITRPEDVTLAGLAQAADEVTVHVITSPLFNVEELNVARFVPALEPLICHWYEGELPPFVTETQNITMEPAQVGFDPDAIETVAVGAGAEFTVIVIPALVTVDGLAQLALDVISHVTTSASESVVLVRLLPEPAETPLISQL